MNTTIRLAIVIGCFCLCAGGVVVATFPREGPVIIDAELAVFDATDFSNAYQSVAADTQPAFNFNQVESVIRHHHTAMSHNGRIEFGLVRNTGTRVEVEVLFFAPKGRVHPILYKLAPERNSWRIVSVERMWFVPRSHLLRGLRV